MAGAYEEQTGLFFFREGEYKPVQQHFNLLYFNRLQQRKAMREFSGKGAPDELK